jgi:predicted porin
MKIIRRVTCFIAVLLFITPPVFSQNNDFGIWYGVNAEYSLKKKLSFTLETEVRTFNNASEIGEVFLEGGAGYKFNKHLSAAGSYRITNNLENDNEYHIRNKWMAELKGDESIGHFNFSGRFRFQRQTRTYFESIYDKFPRSYGRIRLKAEYKTPSFPINPYIYFETFFRMFEQSEKRFNKDRYAIGFEYKLTKRQSVEAEYFFQRDYLPHISGINIISLEYNLKFKSSKNKQE